jgi:hypothetical protein
LSRARPKGVETFDFIDNVWVAEPLFAIPPVIALHESLTNLAGLPVKSS